MQCLGQRQGQAARSAARRAAFVPFSGSRNVISHAAGNGTAPVPAKQWVVPKYPSPAETARTVVDLVNEGVLSTVSACGVPMGIPVSYTVSKSGEVKLQLDGQSLSLTNLAVGAAGTCSLTVQATTMPARAVAAVTLVGKVEVSASQEHNMVLDKCLYFGGMDQTPRGHEISAADFAAAEPDVLRKAAVELVQSWNSERAEDIYRIVGQHLGIALADMAYAELLWIDHVGMYVRCEAVGKAPEIVRIPFYRPVLDERDARSVITMAAQIAWEQERNYTPPIPSIFADAANN